MDTDSKIVENLIGCGRYQFWHFLLFQWITILQACNIAFMVFGKHFPQFDCESGCVPVSYVNQGTEKYELFEPNLNNISDDDHFWKCKNLTATRVVQFHSIAIEWRLYCSKEETSYLILTTQMVGILIGSLVFGQLSDLYGRRKVLFAALLSQIICGAVSSFSTGWIMFTIFRAFIGFFGGGTHTTNQVFFAEMVGAKHRLWLSNIGGWPLGVGVFVVIAWLTKDWRTLSLYSNLVCLPTLLLLWKLDESPRWRLQHGYLSEAERTLRKFIKAQNTSKKDLKKLDDDLRTLTKSTALEDRPNDVMSLSDNSDDNRMSPKVCNGKIRYTYRHLFVSPRMRNCALVVALTHFTSSCIAHGIMFNADALSGDIYANMFLLAAFRWLMNIVTIAADSRVKCGRKHIYIFPSIAIAICSGIIVFKENIGHSSTVTGLALAAGALSSPLWISTLLWPAELFPTPVRNLASSFGAVFDRLGGVMIPLILLLAKLWPPAPYAVFALLAIVAALAVAIVLPETKGHPLPEKMPNDRLMNTWEQEELVKQTGDEGNASPA